MYISQAFGRIAELSVYFDPVSGEYVFLQFKGWQIRNEATGRVSGNVPSWKEHPDVGKAFTALPPETQNFIRWMSQWQLVMFTGLSRQDLAALRGYGQRQAPVPDPLLGLMNRCHHQAWMAARDSFELLGLGQVKLRDEHRSHHLLTEAEIAADNKQVNAYAGILAAMPDEYFEELLQNCRQ